MYSLRLRSCRLTDAIVRSPLPSMLSEALPNSRAPSLRGHYPASSLRRARPPPSRRQPISRGNRLYGLPCSAAFAVGRGGLLHWLLVSSSPCRRSHPAGGESLRQPACNAPCCLRAVDRRSASGSRIFEATLAFTHVTARQLAHHPPDGLVDGLQGFGLPPPCHPSYGTSGSCPGGSTSH